MLGKEQRRELIKIARESVEAFARDGKILDFKVKDEALNKEQGAFVTLHKNGDLRGCIGLIESHGLPLWQVVRNMAIAAASEDYRFNPVGVKELADLNYEISVLSIPKKIMNWRDVELGLHGVIIKKEMSSGVFLPQVATETGWTKEEFLSRLCADKAGLAPDSYKNDPKVELYVFEAEVF
jgi:AmmeMemoRadiSam system protein A